VYAAPCQLIGHSVSTKLLCPRGMDNSKFVDSRPHWAVMTFQARDSTP
jgi:hypothetical protein